MGYIHVYCKKCGLLRLQDEEKKRICEFCNSGMFVVPEKYENTCLTMHDEPYFSECVKSSPEYDPSLHEQLQVYLNDRSRKYNEMMARGRAILEEQKHVPKCTYCGSTNIKKIGFIDRGVSGALWGFGSKKIGKQFHCNNCGADF